MALGARVIWELRTNGNDTNGGGFDPTVVSPGTDFSQQPGVQTVYSDLTVDGTTNTIVTSSGNPFGTTHPGNLINITSSGSWTPGWYEILSVSGVQATLDRSPAATSTSGGAGNLGGCLQTFAKLETLVVAENRIYVKTGVYTETITTANVGSTFYYGYCITRGDNPTGTSRPFVNAATLSHAMVIQGDVKFFNMRFASSTGDCISHSASFSRTSTFVNCKFSNAGGTGINTNGNSSTFTLLDCEISNNSSHGGINNSGSQPCYIYGCYIHSNAGWGGSFGVGGGGTYVRAIDCIFASNTSGGITNAYYNTPGIIKNCIFYSNTGGTSDGINLGMNTPSSGDIPDCFIYNCIFSKNGRYGVNNNTASASGMSYDPYFFDYNMYFQNGTAAINGTFLVLGPHDTTINDPHFVDPINGNFTYDSMSVALASGFAPMSEVLATPFFVNRGIDQGDKRWIWGDGTVTRNAVTTYGSNTYSVQMTPTGGSNVPIVWEFLVPVTATIAFTLSFYQQISSGFNGTMNVSIYDTNDASPLLYEQSVTLTNNSTFNLYTSSSVTPTTPSGLSGNSSFCRCVIRVFSGTVAGSVYIDNVTG